ncbi:undecaprenyl-diphosphate phosphatase [Chondromyces apiculatus]|uniref:Undecaprenyl-diphosphatase n=1 Tax=Chondromyces apiculatus DSM 436 TaxID=1192034 RepID=A0A017T9N3_9BACT|nr:undecaprenyl-diphosphate phosphatase [Chondromyces apiculatus]EYF05949.1 Undecaprenyl-diphosphatase [Chondromyces apiculatus DSM 436]
MSPVDVVLFAALQGAAEVLPISASAHVTAARIWLGLERDLAVLTGVAQLATAAAVVVLARHTLLAAFGEGLRAISRPSLFRDTPGGRDMVLIVVGAAMSLALSAVLRPYVALWSEAPLAQGLGLVISGAALASAIIAPPPGARAEAPGVVGMVGVGLAHGLGVAPGASALGAALVVLMWLGVRPGRALDLALAISVPTLLVEGARSLGAFGAPGVGASIGAGSVAGGLVVAFLGASLAGVGLRWLLERRWVAALAVWMIPLGLATVAYARALPGMAGRADVAFVGDLRDPR